MSRAQPAFRGSSRSHRRGAPRPVSMTAPLTSRMVTTCLSVVGMAMIFLDLARAQPGCRQEFTPEHGAPQWQPGAVASHSWGWLRSVTGGDELHAMLPAD